MPGNTKDKKNPSPFRGTPFTKGRRNPSPRLGGVLPLEKGERIPPGFTVLPLERGEGIPPRLRRYSPLKQKAVALVRELKKLHPHAKIALNYGNNWELMVAVQLSAQCTDKKVNEVTEKLFSAKGGSASGGKKYRTLDDSVKAKPSEFEQDIHSCGFYRAKTKNILAAAKIVKENFGGKLPRTMKEMLTIPGVARKTANVVLGNAYGVVEGIAIDTHLIRLTRLFGLTQHKDPVKIERDIMALIPKKEWFAFTYRMIDYGRTHCTARCKHTECPLQKYIIQPTGGR